VAHYHHLTAFQAVQVLAQIDNDVWISLDLQQALTCRLVGFVHPHQLVAVEPYAAAASRVGVGGDPARPRGQDVGAVRTIQNTFLALAIQASDLT
jgi:hypothetical protein